MRKNVILIWMVAILLLSTSGVLGQSGPKANYLEYVGENQSRNLPAGVVMDPGSHLTYLIDTGYNLRELNGDPRLDLLSGDATRQDLVNDTGVAIPDGKLDLFKSDPTGNGFNLYTNFVTITNTHPTQAVTIHFRLFNDNCDDLLDFLVVLTCNDTLIFDPLNFVIPDSGGVSTASRFFEDGSIWLDPLQPQDWGSGRFILTAMASGVSIDPDDDAEILFPEGYSGPDHCNIQSQGTLDGTLDEIVGGVVANKGVTPGLSGQNLHVFNSSQISYNFLIGSQSTAIPGGTKTIADLKSVAYGVPAWGRPAIDRIAEISPYPGPDPSGISGKPDGDGPAAPTGKILTGGELVLEADGVGFLATNALTLRNDVHGGDVLQIPGANSTGGNSEYGALGTTSFLAELPDQLIQHFISIADDYDGSSNTGVAGPVSDTSANIVPAATTYIMQLYDNNEELFWVEPDTPLNVSPPVEQEVIELKLICFCLRTFLTEVISKGTNVDDVSIQDLADVFGNEVLNGGGANPKFDGFNNPGAGDASRGWIRWTRDNTNTVILSLATTIDIGGPDPGIAHGPGTSTFDPDAGFNPQVDIDLDDLGPSFFTQALQVTYFQPGGSGFGFGVGNWEFAVASDPAVSDSGLPQTNFVSVP